MAPDEDRAVTAPPTDRFGVPEGEEPFPVPAGALPASAAGPSVRAPQEAGARGEDIACRYLWKRGFRLLRRNFRGWRGEIDLIAEKGGRLHFIEVKTRTSDSLGRPEDRVDAGKQARLRTTAREFLDAFRDPPPAGSQFDVVAIRIAPGRPPEVEWLPDCF